MIVRRFSLCVRCPAPLERFWCEGQLLVFLSSSDFHRPPVFWGGKAALLNKKLSTLFVVGHFPLALGGGGREFIHPSL